MALYCWVSDYLKDYAPGWILVEADSVETARARARRDFETDLRNRYDYLFTGLSKHEILENEEIQAERERFEFDIAAEPEILNQAVFIRGSA